MQHVGGWYALPSLAASFVTVAAAAAAAAAAVAMYGHVRLVKAAHKLIMRGDAPFFACPVATTMKRSRHWSLR